MQILEKCMEDMKAVYRLNEEKLDFNTRVLDERSAVNNKSKNMLKKRRNRYKGTLSIIIKDYGRELQGHQAKNLKYTNDFKRFTKLFKELQMKFERFEKSDKERLKNVWVMNQQEA
jgi:dynein regulatory complex protein 1